jgi:hypothetical protein
MATQIKPKRSNVAGNVPTTSNLAGGELGVNMADKKVFINNGTEVVQIGAGSVAALGDVSASAPVAGDALIYTGTAWANTDRINAKTIYEAVKNVSNSTLPKGTPVYQVGMSGNAVTVAAARADDPAKLAIGVLDENIATEAEGRMLVLGEIKGVNTSAFAVGDKIYLGETGGYTNVPPATAARQFLGVVFRVSDTNGSGYITGTLLPDAVRWSGTALEVWTGTEWQAVGNGGAGGGITYVVKTSDYAAKDKEGVLTDTSNGAFTVTLPATPTTGAQVVVADSGGLWGTNNLTVARNGSTIEGASEDLILDIGGASVHFIYDGTTWETYAQIGVQASSGTSLDGGSAASVYLSFQKINGGSA